MSARTDLDPTGQSETLELIDLEPWLYTPDRWPTCKLETAERFGLELGACAVNNAEDCGIIAVRLTGGTCREVRACLLGISAIGNGVADRLTAKPKAGPRRQAAFRLP